MSEDSTKKEEALARFDKANKALGQQRLSILFATNSLYFHAAL
jgi:hypothetical protein